MKYKILRNTVFKGKPVNANEIVEVDEKDVDMRFLVVIGKAEKKETAVAKPKEKSDAPEIEKQAITPPENASEKDAKVANKDASPKG